MTPPTNWIDDEPEIVAPKPRKLKGYRLRLYEQTTNRWRYVARFRNRAQGVDGANYSFTKGGAYVYGDTAWTRTALRNLQGWWRHNVNKTQTWELEPVHADDEMD